MQYEFFPPLEPFDRGLVAVSSLHQIYYERCGNPQGIPVVFLHGGPGGGISPDCRRFFDPKKYHVILFDQRGSGKSLPHASLEENTTWDLVADIEKLRQFLKIEKWAVFGGSWGSTLALVYAITHPDVCLKLFLRGIFLLRDEEIRWFYQEGASYIFPDAWRDYLRPIPEEERGDLLTAYYKLLTDPDKDIQKRAAQAFATWEVRCSRLQTSAEFLAKCDDDQFTTAIARIEAHYFMHKGFFEDPNFILNQVQKIRHLPAVIVHGRYDMVCPVKNAYDLNALWPEAELLVIPDAGHSMMEPGIKSALIQALNNYTI